MSSAEGHQPPVSEVPAHRLPAGSAIRPRSDAPWLCGGAARVSRMTGLRSCAGGCAWSAERRPIDRGWCASRRPVRRRPGTGSVHGGLRQRHGDPPLTCARHSIPGFTLIGESRAFLISDSAAVRQSGSANPPADLRVAGDGSLRAGAPSRSGTCLEQSVVRGALVGRLRAGRVQTKHSPGPGRRLFVHRCRRGPVAPGHRRPPVAHRRDDHAVDYSHLWPTAGDHTERAAQRLSLILVHWTESTGR
jgi:hypothetical protein